MQTETLIGILIVIAAFAFIAWRYSVQRKRDRETPPSGGGGGGGGRKRNMEQ